MNPRWQDAVRELITDHRAPASAIAERAATLLAEIAAADRPSLAAAARALVTGQPAMAPLLHVANVALRADESLGAESVEPALAALRRTVDADRRAAASALARRFTRPRRVVTVSASAAVVTALEALRREDLLEEVVCAESRPMLEGTALARWLAEQNYDVTLVCDAAAGEALDRDAVLVVGADAILPHGVVHKRGTRMLAGWALVSGAERYVVATRDKVWPAALLGVFADPQRPASEVVQKPPAGLRVDNRAFDVSALRLWSAIFVGAGAFDGGEVQGDGEIAAGLAPLGAARPASGASG